MWIPLISPVLLKYNVFPMRSNVPGARATDDPNHSEESDTNKGSAEESLKSPKNAAPNLEERMKKMEAEIKVMHQK